MEWETEGHNLVDVSRVATFSPGQYGFTYKSTDHGYNELFSRLS